MLCATDWAALCWQVSWIRMRDWHILSTGPNTYTQDERFTVRHTPGTNDWTLAIKFVQQRDQGQYVCQGNRNHCARQPDSSIRQFTGFCI